MGGRHLDPVEPALGRTRGAGRIALDQLVDLVVAQGAGLDVIAAGGHGRRRDDDGLRRGRDHLAATVEKLYEQLGVVGVHHIRHPPVAGRDVVEIGADGVEVNSPDGTTAAASMMIIPTPPRALASW